MYVLCSAVFLTVLKQAFAVMCEPPKDTDYADGLKKQQMILQFDMDTWKVFILFGVFLSQY